MKSFDVMHAEFACEHLSANCEQMIRRLNGLLNSKGRVAEEVHAIRKLGKTLRGGFSLLGLENSSAREIQAIGRLLSGPRDAVSRLNTWKKVGWADDVAATSAIHELLVQQINSAARRPPQATIDWCTERVLAALENLQQLPPEGLPERLAKCLKTLKKQASKRCRKLDRRGEEDFHDARKALKAYLGALAFLPEGSYKVDEKLTELPELLGDENNLATLSFWLEQHGFTERFVPTLWEKITETKTNLRKEAMHSVAVLFKRARD